MAEGSGIRVVFVLGADVLTTALCRRGRVVHGPVTRSTLLAPWDGSDSWPDLERAFGDVMRLTESAGGSKHFLRGALLPPLCESRLLDRPDLPEEGIRALLAGHTERYFLRPAPRPVLALSGAGPGANGARIHASVCSGPLFEAIVRAARAAGFPSPLLAPASVAIAAGVPGHRDCALEIRPRAAHRRLRVTVRGGLLAQLGGADPDASEPAFPPEEWLLSSADLAACVGIQRVKEGFFQGDDAITARRHRHRRLRQYGMAATLALLLCSAWLRTVDMEREIRWVTHERAEIHQEASAALALRTAAAASLAALSEIQDADQLRTSREGLLQALERIPPDAHLVSLTVSADTLEVEGIGTNPHLAAAEMGEGGCLSSPAVVEAGVTLNGETLADAERRFVVRFLLADCTTATDREEPSVRVASIADIEQALP